jgi:hypothetical protein
MSRSHKEIEQAFEDQKASEYTLVKATGFDSAEIWDLWYDSDEDINTFIDSLHKLEVDALLKMDDVEAENE